METCFSPMKSGLFLPFFFGSKALGVREICTRKNEKIFLRTQACVPWKRKKNKILFEKMELKTQFFQCWISWRKTEVFPKFEIFLKLRSRVKEFGSLQLLDFIVGNNPQNEFKFELFVFEGEEEMFSYWGLLRNPR